MKLKRILALALSLCMILPFVLVKDAYAAGNSSENLAFEELNGDEINLDLKKDDITDDELVVENLIDENGMVNVFIIMEGESIIEEDASAVMDEDTQAKVEALEEIQAEVVAQIEETVLEGESLEVSYNYTWLFNGVAAQIPYSSMSDIAALDGVKHVVVQPVYEIFEDSTTQSTDASLNTVSDGVMVGRESTWANGYTGKGIKIAIIDTGIDVDHQNFGALSEDKLTEDSATIETVEAVLSQLNASRRYSALTVEDVYYNSKIAFGFNYSDDGALSLNITHDNDTQGDHGTHVAGIAAANKVDGSNVVGVAPDAQLYIMKIFGYERAGSADDIVAALEDALILGADVVNMSLGVTAGFTSSGDEFIDSIYARVAETNTVLSVSAGNNYTAGLGNLWGTNANLTTNPDNSVIGEPAVYSTSFSVASVENWKIERNYIDADGYQMGYVETSASYGLPAIMTLTGEYGLVVVPGNGEAADYEGLDAEGKIALVQRGVINFGDKCQNAADAGAVACLIYNNTSGEFYMDLTDCAAGIPCASITLADGTYLISAVESNPDLKLSFPTELASIPSEEAYQMSDFSSWGVAPDLSLEPDITAPGGNIYSTLDGGEYGLMSGTSMAAPNISGLSALVMQYVKENFGSDYRTVVQDLLMSTSSPLAYGDSELYYSPRSQGSGLANAFNAVSTEVYLTVDGCDTPKAELGDDAERTGSYSFTFNVTNFGTAPAFYDLATLAQSEGYTTDEAYEGVYFMSSSPVALEAATAENSDSMVLTYDVDNDGTAGSHDAYYIYRTANGKPVDEDWEHVSFRYDVNSDEAVSTDDVQAYLDALVGKASDADLDNTVLCVESGETTQVTVTVDLSEADKTYFDTYYTNGGYVEGYTFLTAKNAGGVDLSLPYLAFYGSWDEAPILDDGDYWDAFNAAEDEVVGNQYINFLWGYLPDYDDYYYLGANLYVDEEFDPSHISISPNGDGYYDSVDDIYTSLLRNAAELTYRYTDVDTGEVYYEQTAQYASKSVYSTSYGYIIPIVYSWYEGMIPLFDGTDAEGNDLANNTRIQLEIDALGAYDGASVDSWVSKPITVDVEAPELLSVRRLEDLNTGDMTLELSFRDNLSVASIILMNSAGTELYVLEGVEDVEPDENGYQNYTVTYDITGITGKLVIMLGDYAVNESYYAVNLAGEGTPYGDLVAFQYDVSFFGDTESWVSFSEGVNADEVVLFNSDKSIVCAEYVNGCVYAQDETGALYGFWYQDMLMDTFELEDSYITTLETVYQDLAYNYADGKLYGLYVLEDSWGVSTYINTINLNGEYYDADAWATVAAYQEDWAANRDNLYGLTLACDDAGNLYVMGMSCESSLNSETGKSETVFSDAQLWKFYPYTSWGYTSYRSAMVGETGLTMDYLQSMTWDHNTETLYWARFAEDGLEPVSELYTVDPATLVTDEEGNEIVSCTKVGTLYGETCAMFAPLTEETAAKDEHTNVPVMDSNVVGTPVLRDDVITMNVGGSKQLKYDFEPWYTSHKDVIWSTDDSSVVTVDQNGVITAVSDGSAVITVTAKDDETKFDTCTVEVSALDLVIEGIVSAQTSGIGSVTGTSTYKYEMVEGNPSFGTIHSITAPDTLNYGLSLSTSVYARGSIWASEYGNTGMIYQINAETGEVLDALEPIDGDMLFGLTYSESQDTFTGIMNMNLYVDLELTHEESAKILGSYDENIYEFTYHKLNMLPYLLESNTGFVTGEYGNGASSEIVFCGITTIDGGIVDSYGDTFYYDTYKDYMGNWAYSGSVCYQPTQTLVLLDNVGRLWYIDEIVGMTKTADQWGNVTYSSADGMSEISHYGEMRNGMMELEVVDEDGNVTYNIFNIRTIVETPLTTMFREGSMPRITYHFSDIEFGGYTADGDPIFAMSLYDYWNNGTTNELYLYIPGHETDELDYETWEYIRTPDRLFALGNTGEYNIIASIHSVKVTGGLDDTDAAADSSAETGSVKGPTAGIYGG